MKELDLLSKFEMARTLYSHGVEFTQIATATGLTQPELIAALKIILREDDDENNVNVSRIDCNVY